MGAYLTDHPPVRDQWYATRRSSLTGCTVLHTAESVMDTVGPDTGAENVAEFIRTRTTPGSYHDLVDSDSAIHLVDYNRGAYHDGTGSNNWALSISWACRTTDWARMTPTKRKAFLRQGAIAFARQQAYRRSTGAPLTELRLITKAQSDAGLSGFIYHGHRDPGRRSDPGVAAPNLFPFAEFLAECRAVLGGAPTPAPIPEDDMPYSEKDLTRIVKDAVWQAPFDDAINGQKTQAWHMYRDMQARLGQLGGQNAALNATVKELSKAVVTLASSSGDDLDVDGLVARIGERIDAAVSDAAKLVTVQVSVDDAPAA